MPMKNLLIIFLTVNVIIAQEKTYFQQYVEYEIDVTLDDQNHTINAYEKLLYKNNSPDKLPFIWFHIWPNAYKNDSTAFAKQAGPESRFARADSLSRGFIDSLDFTVNGEKIDLNKINFLATLPSLDELHGRILGIIMAPAQKITSIVKEPGGQLARLISKRSEQLAKSN